MPVMLRTFSGRPLELLAPAGTFEILQALMDSRCDAVYCGGESLNMRMIRKGYNLNRRELEEAVALAREKDKKLYITVNSLLEQDELPEAREYLDFLQELQPHGIIIQDAALLEMAFRQGVTVPLHASVMMNVHNLEGIRFLEKHGVTRVVLSREMPLSDVRTLAARTTVELEYFVHGDMCVTHGSQCLYSSYLFGMSSNRGRCLKPCRWAFSIPGAADAEPYPLAVKDMNLYAHLSDLITSGVSSFKIEGRMRSREFLVGLVHLYADALDRFLDDPLARVRGDEIDTEPYRKRDYSTGYAFGVPGRKNINRRGEGTGEFYSTGKMFSTPTAEREIDREGPPSPAEESGHTAPKDGRTAAASLTVRVDSFEQALLALRYSPRRLYLSGEPWAPRRILPLKQMEELRRLAAKSDCGLYLTLPRMMGEGQSRLFRFFLEKEPPLEGFLVSHFGALAYLDAQKYHLAGDTSLNITNGEAVRFYHQRGLAGWTASLELPFAGLVALAGGASVEAGPGEVFFHGRPSVMYLDHDVSGEGREELELVTAESRLTVRRDCWDRYHLLPEKELSLLPRTEELIAAGYGLFRLDLQGYHPEAAEERLRAASEALQSPRRGAELLSRLTPQGGFTYGAHQ